MDEARTQVQQRLALQCPKDPLFQMVGSFKQLVLSQHWDETQNMLLVGLGNGISLSDASRCSIIECQSHDTVTVTVTNDNEL